MTAKSGAQETKKWDMGHGKSQHYKGPRGQLKKCIPGRWAKTFLRWRRKPWISVYPMWDTAHAVNSEVTQTHRSVKKEQGPKACQKIIKRSSEWGGWKTTTSSIMFFPAKEQGDLLTSSASPSCNTGHSPQPPPRLRCAAFGARGAGRVAQHEKGRGRCEALSATVLTALLRLVLIVFIEIFPVIAFSPLSFLQQLHLA